MPRRDWDCSQFIDLGVWSRSLSDQALIGDNYLAMPVRNGVLVAVADGLGHGEEAAAAAGAAMRCLDAYAGSSVISLFQHCHASLKRTRGVVMSLAVFNGVEQTLTWLGVGNVEGVLLRADSNANPPRETILLRGGVVGLHLPQLHAAVMPISPGDTLVFATDGASNAFANALTLFDSPQRLADRIGGQFCKGTDDALVLAGRYRGH